MGTLIVQRPAIFFFCSKKISKYEKLALRCVFEERRPMYGFLILRQSTIIKENDCVIIIKYLNTIILRIIWTLNMDCTFFHQIYVIKIQYSIRLDWWKSIFKQIFATTWRYVSKQVYCNIHFILSTFQVTPFYPQTTQCTNKYWGKLPT